MTNAFAQDNGISAADLVVGQCIEHAPTFMAAQKLAIDISHDGSLISLCSCAVDQTKPMNRDDGSAMLEWLVNGSGSQDGAAILKSALMTCAGKN